MVSSDGLMAVPGEPFVVDSEDPIVKSMIENKLVMVVSPEEPVQVAESTQEVIPAEEEISPEVVPSESDSEFESEEVDGAAEEKSALTRTTRKKTSMQVKES